MFRSLLRSALSKRSTTLHSHIRLSPRQTWRHTTSYTSHSAFSAIRTMSSKVTDVTSSHSMPIAQTAKATDAKPQKLSPSLIPPGWYADPADLWRASEAFPKSSYGIKESLPVIPIIADRGGCPSCLVECPEGTYYLWNQMSDDLWKVVSPVRLEEIVTKLNDPDLKGMEIRQLEEVGEDLMIADPVTH